MLSIRPILLLLLTLLTLQTSQADEFSHQPWDQLLKSHVVLSQDGLASQVDYAAMAQKRPALKGYLTSLSNVSQKEFDAWHKDAQLAFLINAYNAWTVELILQAYPELESIKELGSFFNPPWSKAFFTLFAQKHSLNDIEHEMIRGSDRYNDPRIHFAVNCASIGCPALRKEAYTGDKLNEQLNQQTQLFLADASRNRLNKDIIEVSSIFKWYREDFEHGWFGIHSLEDLFVKHAKQLHLTEKDVQELKSGDIDIEFLDYDWSLNDVRYSH